MVTDFDLDLQAPTVLLPRGQSSVQLVDDEAARRQVEQGLQVTLSGSGTTKLLRIGVSPAPPLPLAYRATYRSGDKSLWTNSVLLRDDVPVLTGFLDAGVAPERVDLILDPDPDAAARTLDITRILGGQVVVRNVVVQGGGRPASVPASSPAR